MGKKKPPRAGACRGINVISSRSCSIGGGTSAPLRVWLIRRSRGKSCQESAREKEVGKTILV